MRVLVVGAGLGGLTLAHGLRQAGIDVAVYEQDGVSGRPQGVSLHFDDRGTAALRACLPPGHVAMAEATMGGPRDRTQSVSEVDGELAVVHSQPLDGAAGPARPGRQVHRPLLRAVLLTGLADTVRVGAQFTGFERRLDGTVRALFADGSTDTADVLVGADGVGSAVRRQYLPQVQVVDTGKRMLMGATALRAVADTGLPGLIGDSPANVQQRGSMMVLGMLRFTRPPLAAREEWLPALRRDAVADLEDYVMWAVPVSQERLGSAGTPAELWCRARDLVADLHPTLRLVVDQAWRAVPVALRIGMIPPMSAWTPGNVTLLGDAIHLAPGFGGNLAMRDAHWLRDALVQADRGEQELHAAIGGYENAMRRDSFPGPLSPLTRRRRAYEFHDADPEIAVPVRGGGRLAHSRRSRRVPGAVPGGVSGDR
ncbi:2-polyprenyl-6-methoxyphenol hydroxylase-like FAD-dependent oxidoreductase [Kibdelosporangium banguiense]|uniref:2-polyprenyl-6-methoxyphenol hydroxylase-like FAD-dependent oxidoreductase n=1 Tax=Kibdelosporangium banguiense TaxID=1365924 RepID=A0ABS4TVC9_9PSEU|nr:NAD(P)/FAD-dependent oxidoreductase [Kibdelosporangium banguiense]MBP2328332.1 2-polyprenyl-6-methoxyphenol hydroxylase-like FAD-dependent oxidoreductase [Kibdelosporangium banguiense]